MQHPSTLIVVRSLLDALPHACVAFDRHGGVLHGNEQFMRLRGGPLPEGYRLTCDVALMTEPLRPLVERAFEGASTKLPMLAHSAPELRGLLSGDAGEGATRCTLSPLELDGERLVLLHLLEGSLDDVVEGEGPWSIHFREALRLALSPGRMFGWYVDMSSREMMISSSGRSLLGFPEGDEPSLEGLLACVHDDDRATLDSAMQRAFSGEAPPDVRFRHIRPIDGAAVWVENRAELVRAPDGRLLGVRGVVLDVNAHVEAEQALDRSSARWRTLVETLPHSLLEVTGDGVVGYARGPLFDEADVVGWPWQRALGDELSRGQEDAVARAIDSNSAQGWEASFVTDEGTRRFFDCVVTPVSGGKQAEGALLLLRETTEEREATERMIFADRMASVGTLTTSVAHDINNPLAALTSLLEMAQDSPALSLDHELVPLLSDALEAARRVRQIVRDLRTLAHAQRDEVCPVDARRVLDATLRIAATAARKKATIERDYDAVANVVGNEPRLSQVFLNLVMNALQAMPASSGAKNRLTLRVKQQQDWVTIDVCDTGRGMAPSVLARLFTPFFTTKPPGEGTGLGLSLSKRFVEQMGGEITVSSEQGKGSTFTVWLKATASSLTPRASTAPMRLVPRARLLLVDDEPLVLRSLQKLLAPHHDVVALASATSALALVAVGEEFDLILCDATMPYTPAPNFVAELSLLHDPPPVVFMTSGAGSADDADFLERHRDGYIEKPFERGTLLSLIAETVTRARERR